MGEDPNDQLEKLRSPSRVSEVDNLILLDEFPQGVMMGDQRWFVHSL